MYYKQEAGRHGIFKYFFRRTVQMSPQVEANYKYAVGIGKVFKTKKNTTEAPIHCISSTKFLDTFVLVSDHFKYK